MRIPDLNVLASVVPWLVGTGPMKEAGILDLLLGGLAKLDIPVLGKVLKVLLEGKGQRWLRSKLVDDLLAILLSKGTHGLREVLRAPLFKVEANSKPKRRRILVPTY